MKVDSSNQIAVPVKSTWMVRVMISAYVITGTGANTGSGWLFKGAVRCNTTTLALLGTPSTPEYYGEVAGLTAGSVNMAVTGSTLQIRVTGVSGQTIRWAAVVETIEVSGA